MSDSQNLHNSDAKESLEQDIIQECLRQARLSFNLALVAIASNTFISLISIGLLLAGQVSQGTATTVGGLASTLVSVQFLRLAKNAGDRLYQLSNPHVAL